MVDLVNTLCQVKEHLELFANLKGVNEARLLPKVSCYSEFQK